MFILPDQNVNYTFSRPVMNSPKYLRRIDWSAFESIKNIINGFKVCSMIGTMQLMCHRFQNYKKYLEYSR